MSDIAKFYEAAGKDPGLLGGIQAAEEGYFAAIKAVAEKEGFKISSNDLVDLKKLQASKQTDAEGTWCGGPAFFCYLLHH
jgi:hypothetical protein